MDKLKSYIESNNRAATTGARQHSQILKIVGVLVALLFSLVLLIGLLAPSAAERAATIVALGQNDSAKQTYEIERASSQVLDEIAKMDPELAGNERERRVRKGVEKAERLAAEAKQRAKDEVLKIERVAPPEKPSAVELTKFAVLSKYKIEERLKDPDSAVFRNVSVYRHPKSDGGYVFCGEVNAKNGFGGMVGYERFVATPIAAVIESMGPTAFEKGWRDMCPKARFVETARWF